MRRAPRPPRAFAPWLTVVLLATACQPAASVAPRSPSAPFAAADERPNILLIIADDFGIDTSPCYAGADKPAMPNLQSLCDEGVVFDTVWVNPQCTPTRATILTGQYGFRTGVRQRDEELDDTPSIHDLLGKQPAPYANAVIGKWHLGGDAPDLDHPATFGIHHYAGFLAGELGDYFDWTAIDGDTAVRSTVYATTWMTDRAIDWVGAQTDEPWFLWLAYNAPHSPYHLPPAELHQQPGLGGTPPEIRENPRPYYLAMAEAMDAEIGRLLQSMPDAVRDNTTVMFIGDNGTPDEVLPPGSALGHSRGTVYEGGVRVPLVVAGHGVTRRGEREDSLVNGTDLFATIARLSGHPDTNINDGMSFEEALTDPNFTGRTHLFTEFPGVWAVRDLRYKLIQHESGELQLFDLQTDPLETQDLWESSPGPDVAAVAEALQTYQQDLQAGP